MSRLRGALGAVALVGAAMVPLALAATVAPASAATFNVQPVPGTRQLNEVACPTSTTCVAVGQFDDPNTGSHGVVVPIINGVAGAPQVVAGTATLNGVACSDATTCVAVGSVTQANRSQNAVVVPITVTSGSLVVGAVQTMSNVEGLNSVACYNTTSCVAVGSSSFQGVVVPITNGVAGVAQFIANDDGGLTGVACYGPTACVAVGNNFPLFESDGVVVLISDGNAGAAQLVTTTSTLNRVACRVSICEATGVAQSPAVAAVVQITNGVPGAPQVVPDPIGINALLGVSCPSDTLCEAVGNADTGVAVPVVSGAPSTPVHIPGTGQLFGITCTTTAKCIAVGTNAAGTVGVVVNVTPPTIVTGTRKGSVLVGSGQSVLIENATVPSVNVVSGGSLIITNSTVTGQVSSAGARSFTACGNTIGSLVVQSSTGPVIIGDAGDDATPGCAGNRINGSVTLRVNRGGVELGANRITSDVVFTANTGAGPDPESAQPELEANTISGRLICFANTPVPVNDGQPNAVSHGRIGQCSAL